MNVFKLQHNLVGGFEASHYNIESPHEITKEVLSSRLAKFSRIVENKLVWILKMLMRKQTVRPIFPIITISNECITLSSFFFLLL